jgi:ribose 5-phosphate isomerase B
MKKTFSIAIGSDHAGFTYKKAIKSMLLAEGHTVRDFGTHSLDRCDYPDFCFPVARAVASHEVERGIVLGEAMAANRVRGVRCGVCWSEQVAIWNRAHNDANCLSLGERTIALDEAFKIVRIWLDTEFEGGRHIPRIQKLDSMA